MNILPFVFAILFILSYGVGSSLQNQIASRRNHRANLGLLRAERRFLQESELEQFKALPGQERKAEAKGNKEPAPKEAVKKVPHPPINPSCAQLNLFPLLDGGKLKHLSLYETAAKFLRLFYSEEVFRGEQLEYKLLDTLIESAKKNLETKDVLFLETILLKDPSLQPMYYTLLKGTKKRFPPLLDYFKIERAPSQVCLFHAHPHMLTLFFGKVSAEKLYQELHNNKKPPLGLEGILQWLNEPHLVFVDAKVWELIDFQRPNHGKGSQKTLISEDEETHICLRKNIQVVN